MSETMQIVCVRGVGVRRRGSRAARCPAGAAAHQITHQPGEEDDRAAATAAGAPFTRLECWESCYVSYSYVYRYSDSNTVV